MFILVYMVLDQQNINLYQIKYKEMIGDLHSIGNLFAFADKGAEIDFAYDALQGMRLPKLYSVIYEVN